MADQQPSYRASASEAAGHGKAFFKSTIGQHPVASAGVLGSLVLLVIILMFVAYHFKTKADKATKSGFQSNLATGNNHGLWWYGNDHAGSGGSLSRDNTSVHLSHYNRAHHPRTATQKMQNYAWYGREGLAPNPRPDYDVDSGVGLPATCTAPWSTDAMLEAQALATVGSYPHNTYGEEQLQGAINTAYDVGGTGLSDADLESMMHNGGSP